MEYLLSVVIPVYNEKSTIREIVKKVKAVNIPKEIILVDDGSTDGSREILKTMKSDNVKVLLHPKNYGKGYAVRTGIKEASGRITIIQDADLEYEPKEFPMLIKPIIDGKSKVVYGTRFPKGRPHPPLTNFFFLANKILTLTANILYNANITDEPTCYKVFDTKVLKGLNLKCIRFEFCPEVTAKVRKQGYKIYELPISYNPRTRDEGKKINWKDGIEAFWTLIKYRF